MNLKRQLVKIIRERKFSDLIGGVRRFLYWNPPLRVLYYNIYIALNRERPRALRKISRMQMILNPKLGGIHKELFIYGIREPYSTEIFKKELRRGMSVIDIGANIGYYCLMEASIVGREGRVYAIEPSLRNLKYLMLNILLNDMRNNIAVKSIADKDGSTAFELSGKAPNLDRIALPSNRAKLKVKTKKLDTFVEEEAIQQVDFIRMDVEGFECRVIKGARKVLERLSPRLFIEIHPTMMRDYGDDIKDFLRKLSMHNYIIKYAIWEPLTPTYLNIYKPPINWRIIKDVKPEELLTNEQIRKVFCRDWVRLFLEK